jgi:hypothetical protein
MYLVPFHDVILSGNFTAHQGPPGDPPDQSRCGIRDQSADQSQSLGSTRLDTLTKIDLRVGKLFRFGERSFEATVDVDNLTNARPCGRAAIAPKRRRLSIRQPEPGRRCASSCRRPRSWVRGRSSSEAHCGSRRPRGVSWIGVEELKAESSSKPHHAIRILGVHRPADRREL